MKQCPNCHKKFIKLKGVNNLGNWYCSQQCIPSLVEQLKNLDKESNEDSINEQGDIYICDLKKDNDKNLIQQVENKYAHFINKK